jgi:diguanylate cyclase (GGDEF)-like protein
MNLNLRLPCSHLRVKAFGSHAPSTLTPSERLLGTLGNPNHPEAKAQARQRFTVLQQQQLLRMLPMALLARALALPLFAWLWPADAWTPWVAALMAALFGVGLAQLGFCLRRPPSGALTALQRGSLMVLASAAAALYAALLLQALALQAEAGRFVLGVFGVVYLGAGTLLYAPVLGVAVGWITSACLLCGLGLAFSRIPGAAAAAWLVPVLAVLLSLLAVESAARTRKRLRESDLVEAERQMLALLLHDFEANASDWLWEVDRAGCLVHVSAHLARALGRPASALLQQAFVGLLDAPDARVVDAQTRGPAELARRLETPLAFADWTLAWSLHGQAQWWQLRARPVLNPQGEWLGWRGVTRDITQLVLQQRELQRLALTDSLTGLANRNGFLLDLQRLLDEAKGARVGLMQLDLDHFKQVNETLGHATADEVLVALAQCLKDMAAALDLRVARLDGDEFALCWLDKPGRSQQDPLVLAGTLQAALDLSLLHNNRDLDLRASIGLALQAGSPLTAGELMRRADAALIEAKKRGGDQLYRHDLALEEAARQRASMVGDLRAAIDANQIELAYQPKWCMRSGRMVGVEALARWQHPQRGAVPPAEFVPLAEEAGLVQALGQAMLLRACREAAAWPKAISVAVNVSAIEFDAPDFLPQVRRALARSGLAPQRLELELTESVFVQDPERVVQRLQALREEGVSVALDDFGTGYSSLAYLQRLPLSTLKIDRAFVAAMDAQPNSGKAQAIVLAIVQLGRAIGAQTVAEGIETQSQLETLKRLGCHVGQGFILSHPLTLEQLLQHRALYAL